MSTTSAPKKRWVSLLIGLLVLVAGAVVVQRLWPKKTIAVRAVTVERGPVRDVVSSSQAGEITPELKAVVRAEVAGTIIEVRHRRGDRVKKGEVILRVDPQDLQARAAQAQAAAQAAAGQVAQAQARLALLRRQADRARLLLQKGAGTPQLAEDTEAAVTEATQAIRAAEGNLRQAQAAAQVAGIARSRTAIVAPFDGLLIDVGPNLGEALAPAAPVLPQIIDDRRLHVDATIDEADAAKVRTGQEASLKLDALPGHPIKGRVALVDPAVKRDLKGSRTLAVEVEVADVSAALAAGLKPGMSANVEIVTAEKADVLNLPSNAVVGRGAVRHAFRLLPEGQYLRAHKVEVGVGLENWERSEVLSGLSAGDRVVITLNVKGLEDGALVKISP